MKEIAEAQRYIDNAKEILSTKAIKQDGYYLDKKYVKMAGHTAYVGVLLALDAFLGVKSKGRKNVQWYQTELAKKDKKIVNIFNSVYDILHLSLSYDGNPNAKIAQIGIEEAEALIQWTKQ